jgi:hypothetical protein
MGTVRTGMGVVERAAYEALLIDYACQYIGFTQEAIKWLEHRIGPLGPGPLVDIQKRKRIAALRLFEADLTFRNCK